MSLYRDVKGRYFELVRLGRDNIIEKKRLQRRLRWLRLRLQGKAIDFERETF